MIEIIIFKNLSRENLKEIVEIQIKKLIKHLNSKKLNISLSEKSEDILAKLGYDPVYGARPLKRTIQRMIINPLSEKILKGEYKEGEEITVDVSEDEEKLCFDKAAAV